jgi:hypothetical protein
MKALVTEARVLASPVAETAAKGPRAKEHSGSSNGPSQHMPQALAQLRVPWDAVKRRPGVRLGGLAADRTPR